MSNPNKAKGSRWERDVRRALGQATLRVTRPWQEGHQDAGDMHIEHLFAGQAKNYANLVDALRDGVDGAVRQAAVAGLWLGVAFVKRRQRGAGDGYAVMRIRDWAKMVVTLRWALEAAGYDVSDLLADDPHADDR